MTDEPLGILLYLLSKLSLFICIGIYLFLLLSAYKLNPKFGLLCLFFPPMLIVFVKDQWPEHQKHVYLGTGALILALYMGISAGILFDREEGEQARREHINYITETAFYPIGNALMDYRAKNGVFPSTTEGLAILSMDNFMNTLEVYPQNREHSVQMQRYLNEEAWKERITSRFGLLQYTLNSPESFTLRIPNDGFSGRKTDYVFTHGYYSEDSDY